ncbi:MAG: polymer-forming cytoskeletal protein [Burkholderiales bacterium]|nr:MAG: polymer-forming cytoskeletal protein [Burkholderiales bacterium]
MKRKQTVTAMPKLSSLLAEDLEIVGDVAFSGGLRVDGRVKGRVLGRATQALAPALLVLSERGRIEGGVHCGNAVIDGTIIGDLTVDECLNLQSNARIDGTIRYRELRMDIGAKVQGRMMRVEALMPPPAADEAVDDAPVAVASAP